MRRILLAALAAAAVTVGMTSGVSADNGATTTHYNLSGSQCYDYGGGYMYCVSSTGEENVTQTSSGNWSGQANVTSTDAFTYNGTVLFSDSFVNHVHILYKNDFTVLQEGGEHLTETSTYGGTTYCFSYDIHITNSTQIQYENVSTGC